jgi:hypothetical protein
MPDFAPDQTPTPGSLLAGTPPSTSNVPLYARPGQPPFLQAPQQQQPQAPQQQPAQPTPQMAVAARHHDIGRSAAFLFGRQQDPATGEPIKQRPGDVFKSLLLGAMLGSSLASEGGSAVGGSVDGFLGGFARGGNAVNQQAYQRQQQAQEQAQKRQQLSLEEQKAEDEFTLSQ